MSRADGARCSCGEAVTIPSQPPGDEDEYDIAPECRAPVALQNL